MREPLFLEPVSLPRDRVAGRLYRVSRPGSALGSSALVPDDAVRAWLEGIADQLEEGDALLPEREVDYVCLLGRKVDGRREVADFYRARGLHDGDDNETLRKPLWETYLIDLAADLFVLDVHHFPSTDRRVPPPDYARRVAQRMARLLERGSTVLVGCATGQMRTQVVVERLIGMLDGRP